MQWSLTTKILQHFNYFHLNLVGGDMPRVNFAPTAVANEK